MYHVADCPSPRPTKKKWSIFSKPSKKDNSNVINTTTTIMDDSNIVTKKNKDFKGLNISPKLTKSSKNHVKLIINPLSTKEVYPNGLDGSYSKLESHSSTESLSSSNDQTSFEEMNTKNSVQETDHDSGYNSIPNKFINTDIKTLLDSLEPISDGIKTEKINGAKIISKSHSFDEKISSSTSKVEENSLVQSWSYCISDSANLHNNCELEISKSAEDFFSSDVNAIVKSIINDVVNKVCLSVDKVDAGKPSDLDSKPKSISKNVALYPIHSHICLYYEIFDSNQILYALNTLKNCILSTSQLFIKCLATSGIKDLKNNDILYLLAKHRKSMLGNGFTGDLNVEYVNFYRGYMFLDVIILICLNFSRTFYPFLDDSVLMKQEEINNNLKIQLESLDILNIIVKNLITMVHENSKGFSCYIADLLIKCKLQKILLHCLLTSVRNFDEDMTFAEEILQFNNFQLCNQNNTVGEHVEAFQIQILR